MTKPNYKESCVDCEDQTDEECAICELPVCDGCYDSHADNHDSDDEES